MTPQSTHSKVRVLSGTATLTSIARLWSKSAWLLSSTKHSQSRQRVTHAAKFTRSVPAVPPLNRCRRRAWAFQTEEIGW